MGEETEGEEYTSLKVTKKLTARLKDMGKKGESYEDIIWRLINGLAGEDADLREKVNLLADKISQMEFKFDERPPKRK